MFHNHVFERDLGRRFFSLTAERFTAMPVLSHCVNSKLIAQRPPKRVETISLACNNFRFSIASAERVVVCTCTECTLGYVALKCECTPMRWGVVGTGICNLLFSNSSNRILLHFKPRTTACLYSLYFHDRMLAQPTLAQA